MAALRHEGNLRLPGQILGLQRFTADQPHGVHYSPDALFAYTRLVTTYLMEYAEDWSSSRAYLSEQSVQAILQPAA